MKSKKVIKMIAIILINLFIYLFMNKNQVYAKMPRNFNINMQKANELSDIGNVVLGTLQVIGTFVAVAALMIKGIKFMLGSVEEKSEQKQTLIYYVIGAILVLAIVNIIPIIYNIAIDLF